MKKVLIVSTAVSLFCGLLLVAGSQKASPAQQPNELAQQAFDLLDKRCGQCHGETGSNKDLMLISRAGRNALVGKRSDGEKTLLVDTAKPEASLLYLRITGKHPSGVMPPSYAANPAPLTQAEQSLVLKWVQAGAPDWKNVQQARPQRRFISNADILQNITRDLVTLDADRRKDTRYFTLTHLYNAGVSETEIAAYRDGLKRLLNSLSWEGDIIIPTSIDPEQTIFRINLLKYGWKAATWQTILQAYPYNIQISEASFADVCKTTDCELPFIRADWFVTHAALPPLYHDILELPSGKDADVILEKRLLDVQHTRDANQDIAESPGDLVWRSGFRKSGVSANNRVVEWHTSLYGYYWKSYDFSDVTGFQNIKAHPLDFQRAGGEIIFGLPNGLQGYMLVSKDGTRLDVAPSNIVSNDKSTTKDKNIYNGLTCMGCHTQGMIDGFDIEEVRDAVTHFPNGEPRRQGLKLYAERSVMQKLLNDGKKRYRDALAKLNSKAGTNEPMVTLAEKFQGDVDADLAAAELGLSTEKFQQIIATLNNPVLNDLKVGKVARKAWEEQISLVIGKMPGAKYIAIALAPLNPVIGSNVANNAKVTATKINSQDGAEMILIPAGAFPMGDNVQSDNPRHTVTLSAYYMYKDLVTVEQYLKFCAATGYPKPPAPDFNPNWSLKNHPIVNVSYEDALRYCEWASKGNVKITLPTEAQWEKAACGTDGRKFPWGNMFDSSKLWCSKNIMGDAGGTTAVGQAQYSYSPYGLSDMAGNVWQWCLDWYDEDFWKDRLAEHPNPVNDVVGKKKIRVLRGGSWGSILPALFQASYRSGPIVPFGSSHIGIGFRCASWL